MKRATSRRGRGQEGRERSGLNVLGDFLPLLSPPNGVFCIPLLDRSLIINVHVEASCSDESLRIEAGGREREETTKLSIRASERSRRDKLVLCALWSRGQL